MVDEETRLRLVKSVADLDEVAALALVRHRLEVRDDPLAIVEDCERGMRLVGERYEQKEYFLAGLIMAGEIFRQVLEVAQPHIEQVLARNVRGRVLIGTVQGDIHNIGKDIVCVALRAFGFTVEDLGVDVPARMFVERASAVRPDIIGLSCILTSSFDGVRETVRLLREDAPPALRTVPIIVGGGQLNEDVCRYMGADYWTSDGMEGVRICERIVQGDGVSCVEDTEAVPPSL